MALSACSYPIRPAPVSTLANAVLGVLTIAVPTVLIGVCKGAMMRCHMVTLPTLIVLGVLLAVLAAIAAYLDLKPAKRA